MRSPAALSTVVVALIALALAASAALLVDYVGAPVFCAEGGGCDALRQTPFAYPFGVPMPIFGVVGFVVLGLLAMLRGAWVRAGNMLFSGVGGVVAILLLALQLGVGHFCIYCAVVDVSTIALAALAVYRVRREWDPPKGIGRALASSVALFAAPAAPIAWASHEANKVPAVIARELAETPPGEVTIVDFVDFECPFCRVMQTRLAPAVEARKDKVRIVRKLVPLKRIHPHAEDAAKAACCGEALGKGEAMAKALFQTPVEDLTPDGCAKVAEQLGLPLDKYNECLASPETGARLARDRQEFDQAAVKGDGLPLMWVGSHKLMGAQDEATLSRVLGDAIARAGS